MNKIVYSIWTFEGDDIKSGNIYLATALMSDSLEANTFTATVECHDKTIVDFERNAPLTYYYNNKQRGIFYVQNISRVGPKEYTISATSAIGLLIEGLHYGGIYTGQTVAEVLPSICGTVPYVIKTNLRDIALYGWLPVATPRDNLSQILFVIGATVTTDLDGVLHIDVLWDGVSGNISKDSLYLDATVDYGAKVTQVVVTEHQYIAGSEETPLFEGTTQDGDIITFDEPMHSLQASGFTILESGANYAKVSSGNGELTGTGYVHNTRQVSVNVSEAQEPNVKTVTDATLVSIFNSLGIANRLKAYYQCVEAITAPIEYMGESAGDVVEVLHPFDSTNVRACIRSLDINISRMLKADGDFLVNYFPPQQGAVEYYDAEDVLLTPGNYIVPDGVTSITAVLISGGKGGTGGSPGSPGTQGGRLQFDYGDEGGQYNGWGWGGEGGDPGTGGPGGRIRQVTMEVTPGQVIPYTIGIGGPGGSAEAAGANGTDTTFGDYSTSGSNPSEVGYYDAISGITYAIPGVSGLKGGRGSGAKDPQDNRYVQDEGDLERYTISNEDGSWTSGVLNQNVKSDNSGNCHAFSGMPLGGGAAYGVNGAMGTSLGTANAGNNGEYDWAQVWAPSGADGATPLKAKVQSVRGGGGNGGHGGGGGGGEGRGTVTYSSSDPHMLWLYHARSQSQGGAGGEGGDGADGLVIVYYQVPHEIESGALVCSDNRVFLDRLGRMIVV